MEILKEEFIKEIDYGIKQIKKNYGIGYYIVKGILFIGKSLRIARKTLDELIKESRENAIKQINLTVESASKVNFNSLESSLNKIVEETFDKYRESDEVCRRCKRNEIFYRKIIPMLKEAYKERLLTAAVLLNSKGENYEEKVRNAYQRKGEAIQEMNKFLKRAEEILKVIEKNKLTKWEYIEIGKKLILYSKKRIKKRIDEIYEK